MNSLITKFFSGLWVTVRPYVIPCVAVICLFYYSSGLFKREKSSIVDRLNQFEALRDQELKKILDAHQLERKEHEENLRRLQTELDAAKKKYDDDLAALSLKKTQQAKKIVKDFGDKPEELAAKVAEVTGFRVVTPGATP